MTELVVNIALIAAVLVLLCVWAVTAARRRGRERRQHAEDRRLILNAFLHPAGADRTSGEAPGPSPVDGRASVTTPAPTATPVDPRLPQAPGQLDAASITALLELLEDRRPARHGLLGSLVTGPRSIWSAGASAGENLGHRTMQPRSGARTDDAATSALYREAAAELIDIHALDPSEAHEQYQRYAASLGDRALADLYVRSAAWATHAEPTTVDQVVAAITGTPPPPEVSEDVDNIDA